MDISFKLDPETIIGPDTLSLSGTICGRYGKRIMIAADNALDSRHTRRLHDILEDSGIETIIFDGIQEDSSVEMAENIVELCRASHCDAVAGFGCRKTLTIARMAAFMAPSRLSVFSLFDGRKIRNEYLPFIAIPTSGMDAFMFTEYFPVIDPRDRLVKAISPPDGMYAAAIIDSSLSNLSSGNNEALPLFEGFCTAAEAYCSAKANFISDALLERSLSMYAKLMTAASGGIDPEINAQANFLAALGTGLSSPGIGAVLPFAVNSRSPGAAKPQIAAALLPLIAGRLVAARPEKMARIASFFGSTRVPEAAVSLQTTGESASIANAANSTVETIRRCMSAFNVNPSLKEFNISLDKLIAVVESARNLEFVSNSPWTVSKEDVFDILKQIV